MDKGCLQAICRKNNPNIWETYEKMLTRVTHQGIDKLRWWWDNPFHPSDWPKLGSWWYQVLTRMWGIRHSHACCKYRHSGEQFGHLINWIHINSFISQQFCLWAYTLKKLRDVCNRGLVQQSSIHLWVKAKNCKQSKCPSTETRINWDIREEF